MKWGEPNSGRARPLSLRVIGSGEPINPEAWVWYYKVIAVSDPVVDTWWQTGTGAPS
jgi:acetyl-CoA synthetase